MTVADGSCPEESCVRDPRRHRHLVRVLLRGGSIAAVAAVMSACTTATSPVSYKPAGVVAPGHESPQAALAGYLTGFAANNPSVACEYIRPSIANRCADAFRNHSASIRRWSIGRALVRGDEALVVMVVDDLCVDRACASNTDPNGALPKQTDRFTQAFNATQLGSPTMPAVRVGRKWYLTLT